PSLVSYGDDSLTVSLQRQVLAKRLRQGQPAANRGPLFSLQKIFHYGKACHFFHRLFLANNEK
ncbi:MAG: hypothetical protein ACRDCL_18275, partial [Aeromonas veronii]